MADIEIKRGYEVLPDNNIRFGIRITNVSNLAVSDVEVILDFTESLFRLEGERLQKVGIIPPASARTVEFVLKPLGCIHNVNIEALVSYRDAKWKRYRVDMRPKEVHCVSPFLKGNKMTRAEFLELSRTGHSAETGLNFRGVSVERLTSYLVQTCKSRHYKVDDFSIDGGRMLYLASESIGEKAYYLLTALIKEDDGLTQVMLRAVSDKPHGLNGFLSETVVDLRHVVRTVQSAQEIGVIKKEQVINIIDSVVQRSTISMEEGAPSVKVIDSMVQRSTISVDEGAPSVKVIDGMVQRTEIKGDEERKRRVQERLRRLREEREEQVRSRRAEEEKQRKEDLKDIGEISKNKLAVGTTRLEKTRTKVEQSGVLGFEKKMELVDGETTPKTKPAASASPPISNEAGNERSRRLRVKWATALGAFGVIIILYILFFQMWTAVEDIGIGKTQTIEATVTPVFTVPEPSTVYVEIKGLGFNPPELNVVKGTTVRWTNLDSAQHVVNGNGFRSRTLNKRDMWNYTFNKTGTFEYDCTIHTSMHGRIIVK